MGNLIGNAKVIGTSTDDVVRTIQALISAGYKGEALLDKIDEIYGVGARNNLLKVIDYEVPPEGRTVIVEYPQISPNEKTKIGDILIGSNGYIGRITALEIDSDDLVSSATILGLDYNIIENILPAITTDDNYKVLTVKDGVWLKDYIKRTNNSLDLYGNDSNGYFENSNIIFEDRYIDGSISQDRTNRSITIEPTFVPYTAEDISLSLRFYDDNDRDIRLTGIRLPKNDTDVANKAYVDHESRKSVSVTYNELKELRDNNELVPGFQYRIIDYTCSVANYSNVEVISNPYDIIVIADTVNKLNENARACLHAGDNYYSTNGSNLAAWELKYCLDNDASRFDWADSENGKGVIYWLKDDLGNECPYDFKQILFKRYIIEECSIVSSLEGFYGTGEEYFNSLVFSDEYKYFYTFELFDSDNPVDCSVIGSSISKKSQYNTILPYIDSDVQKLNNIIIFSKQDLTSNVSKFNKFGYNCYYNTLGIGSKSNLFRDNCYTNIIRSIFTDNIIENEFNSNLIGQFCSNSKFGYMFSNNAINSSCSGNIFDSDCNNIVLGSNSASNVFGCSCSYITLGDLCLNNIFNNYCSDIVFSNNADGLEVANKFFGNELGNSCKHLILYTLDELQVSDKVRYYFIVPGTSGTSKNKLTIELNKNGNYTVIGNAD